MATTKIKSFYMFLFSHDFENIDIENWYVVYGKIKLGAFFWRALTFHSHSDHGFSETNHILRFLIDGCNRCKKIEKWMAAQNWQDKKTLSFHFQNKQE